MQLSSKTLRETTAAQIRLFRLRRGVSQQGLADRLNQLGALIDRTAVAKVETGKRELSLGELFAFALALDVAPIHLLVPIDSNQPIRLAPQAEAAPHEVRAWIRGAMPMLQDPTVYFTTVPDSERQAGAAALAAWLEHAPMHVTTDPEEET